MRRVWIAVVLSMGSFVAAAQEPKPQPQEKPKEVIVTSSPLNPHGVFDTPYGADVVTGPDADRRGLSRSLPDLLKESPGVSLQKTGPHQGSPFIRGFTGFRNVMLVDGIRLNNSTFREGPNQYWGTVDGFMIDRLEIVRGPSSVLYGSDSIGGTVSAITKMPAFDEPEAPFHARSYFRYATAEDSYSARQEAWGSAGDLGWFVGGTYRDFNDILGGRHYGEMVHSRADEYDVDLKIVARLSKDSKLVLAAQHHRTDDAPRWHSTADSRGWHGSASGTDRLRDFDQERNLYYLQYHGTFEGGAIDALRASVSLQRQGELENRIQASGARQVRESEVNTPAAWVQAGKQTSLGHFTGGVEYSRDLVDSKGHDWSAAGALTTFDRGNVADDATYDLYGVYLQDELSVGPLDLTPGVRFSRARVDAKKVDPAGGTTFAPLDETYQAVTGSFRLLWHVEEHWNLVAGWGMGFRSPSLDDSTAVSFVLSGALDTPATDLDPEKTHTFDLGLRSRYDAWEVSAFAFYTLLDDFIQRVPIPDFNGDGIGDFTKQNFSKGYVYGFEISALYRLTEELSFFGDWGYAKGEVDQLIGAAESRQPLSKMGPSLLHVGARYEPKGGRVWVEALLTAARAQHHLSVSDGADPQRIPPGGTPGYTVYTLRGGTQIGDHVAVTLSIENLFNKDYRVHGSGQNEPGTNVILGLDLQF